MLYFLVLAIGKPQPVPPHRFMGAPPFKPPRVHAIPGTIAVAPKDSLQAEKNVAAGLDGLEVLGETRGRITRDGHNFSVGPFGGRPIRRTVKCDLMAGIRQGTPQPFQVGFGAAGPGKPSTSETNFHGTCLERLL